MKKISRYTVSFIFTPKLDRVWLIKKVKPEWQKGLYNGIGGKIEEGENVLFSAKREIKEESGTEIENLIRVGEINGLNMDGEKFCVTIFTAISDKGLKTSTKEKVRLVHLDNIKYVSSIDNLNILLEACLLKIKQPKMNSIILSYK
jgi:8-oxo-dGTP diphosphatase